MVIRTESSLRTAKYIGIVALLIITSCTAEKSNEISEAEARNQILKLHESQRTYHFEKMADEFVEQLSLDHISVNRGEIRSFTKEELRNRISNYFKSVAFEKWDDVNPPIIRFSNDLSLAYTIVDKEVVVNYADENGVTQKEKTKFSWVAIYKRYGEEWKIDCVASTNKASVKI